MTTLIVGGLLFPVSAEAKVIGYAFNEGLEPLARLRPGNSRDIERPREIKFRVVGTRQVEIEARFRVECYLDGAAKSSERYTFTGVSPASHVVPLEKGWDYCRVSSGFANYADTVNDGGITIRIWGKRR